MKKLLLFLLGLLFLGWHWLHVAPGHNSSQPATTLPGAAFGQPLR